MDGRGYAHPYDDATRQEVLINLELFTVVVGGGQWTCVERKKLPTWVRNVVPSADNPRPKIHLKVMSQI